MYSSGKSCKLYNGLLSPLTQIKNHKQNVPWESKLVILNSTVYPKYVCADSEFILKTSL